MNSNSILTILTIIAGSGLLVVFVNNLSDWILLHRKDDMTEYEQSKYKSARHRSLLSLLIIAILVFVVIYLQQSPGYPPTSETPSPTPSPTVELTVEPTRSDDDNSPIKEVEKLSFSNGIYSGLYDSVNLCPEGNGLMLFDNGDTYEGSWSQGKKNGTGKMTYRNGDTYNGSWENDMKHGHGVYTWNNGCVYDGDYKNDKRNGAGTFKNWTGTIYNGELWTGEYYGLHVNNIFEGYGKFTITNGDVFEGIFRDGKAWDGIYTRDGEDYEIRNGVQIQT